MANMRRPLLKSDAILGHVASWGDRFPMPATKSQGEILSIGNPYHRTESRVLPLPRLIHHHAI
jgi:hypothetical protein